MNNQYVIFFYKEIIHYLLFLGKLDSILIYLLFSQINKSIFVYKNPFKE